MRRSRRKRERRSSSLLGHRDVGLSSAATRLGRLLLVPVEPRSDTRPGGGPQGPTLRDRRRGCCRRSCSIRSSPGSGTFVRRRDLWAPHGGELLCRVCALQKDVRLDDTEGHGWLLTLGVYRCGKSLESLLSLRSFCRPVAAEGERIPIRAPRRHQSSTIRHPLRMSPSSDC